MKCGTPNTVARKACTQTPERALFVKEEKENVRILIEYVLFSGNLGSCGY